MRQCPPQKRRQCEYTWLQKQTRKRIKGGGGTKGERGEPAGAGPLCSMFTCARTLLPQLLLRVRRRLRLLLWSRDRAEEMLRCPTIPGFSDSVWSVLWKLLPHFLAFVYSFSVPFIDLSSAMRTFHIASSPVHYHHHHNPHHRSHTFDYRCRRNQGRARARLRTMTESVTAALV